MNVSSIKVKTPHGVLELESRDEAGWRASFTPSREIVYMGSTPQETLAGIANALAEFARCTKASGDELMLRLYDYRPAVNPDAPPSGLSPAPKERA